MAPLRNLLFLLLAVTVLVPSCAAFAEAAALVNGEKVTPSTLEEEIEQVRRDPAFAEAVRRQGGIVLGDQRREALTVLIRLTLLRQEARRMDIDVTEGEIDAFVEEIAQSLGGQQQFEAILQQAGISRERARVIAERQLLEREVRREVTSGVEVNEDQLRQAYEANQQAYQEVHLQRITVPTAEQAQQLREQIAAGASFADLAREHSTDELAEQAGDMGFVTVAELDQQVQVELQDVGEGEITQPVATPGGFTIYQVVARRAQPLEAVREQIADQVLQAEGERAFRDWFFERLSRADIVVNPKYGTYDEETLQVVPAPDRLPR